MMMASTFIKIIHQTWEEKKEPIVGCIYIHHALNNQDFVGSYILPLLGELSYENKEVMLMRDFNIIWIFSTIILTRELPIQIPLSLT